MSNLQPSSEGAKNVYKVIAGSFKSKENAANRVSFLQSKGIEAFVQAETIMNERMFRVQAGAFTIKENADKRLEQVIHSGIADAFIVSENTPVNQTPIQESIMGEIILSSEQLDLFVKDVSPQALEIGSYYISFGNYYGIRGDIAFAQAILETDYFRFTGIVQPHQNNFSGLGSIGPDDPGAFFKTPSEGVLAHMQHLFAYATNSPLPSQYPLVDPRFHLVKRGSARAWVDLNGKWAVPGHNYGQTILNIYQRMLNRMSSGI